MDIFNKNESLKDKIEDHLTTNIPNNLSWNKLGPPILKGVGQRKKRRRKMIWFWGLGFAIIGISTIGWCFRSPMFDTNTLMPKLETERVLSEIKNTISAEDTINIYSPDNIENTTGILLVNNKPHPHKTIEVKKSSINYVNSDFLIQLASIDEPNSSLSPKNHLGTIAKSLPQSRHNEKDRTKDRYVSETEEKELRTPIDIQQLPIQYSLVPIPSLSYGTLNNETILPQWQLELSGGINWWDQGFINEGSFQSINTPLNGWNFNARINKKMGKHFSIKLGLDIQNLRYKSAFENIREIPVYQPNTIDVVYINTITYRDYIPGTETRKFQHFNQHLLLQIPLLAGFTIGNNRWKYSIHTGIGVQFLHSSSGRISLSKGTVIDLPDRTIYPSNLRVNYLLETQFAFQISREVSLFARLSMNRHFTNWLSEEFVLKQKPKIGSSAIGLAWDF